MHCFKFPSYLIQFEISGELKIVSSRNQIQISSQFCRLFLFQYSLAPPRYGSASGVQPPRQYGFSGALQAPNPSQAGWGQTMAPPKTGIPRPGSRIPGPRTTSGIPKPGGGGYSQPGSRASSQGPRKMSADNYY